VRDDRRIRSKAAYRPKVEALEALRMLDAGLAPLLAPAVVEHRDLDHAVAADLTPTGTDAWDAALDATRLADLLGRADAADPAEVQSGLDQFQRYLARTWTRAGIAPRDHEDCTQTVYEVLLRQFGRDGFDRIAAEVGRRGVSRALSWESPDGPDFFRAIDLVKKRSQRLKTYQSLDDHYADLTDSAGGDGASVSDWRGALDEAIDRTLGPREAALIRETLLGKTPAEIAQDWGVASKTVSNLKTRAIQSLREALVADLADG
jgi:RNA polymerase sigma factor (sigma-70 family)